MTMTTRPKRLLMTSFLLAAVFASTSPLFARAQPGPAFWRVIGLGPKEYLAIRASPAPRGTILGKIPVRSFGIRNLNECESRKDEPSARSGRQDGAAFWCKVEFKGITGWVVRGNLAADF